MSDDSPFMNPFRRRANGKGGNGSAGHARPAPAVAPPSERPADAPPVPETDAASDTIDRAQVSAERPPGLFAGGRPVRTHLEGLADQLAAAPTPSEPQRQPPQPEPQPHAQGAPAPVIDLADHFLGCAKLGRYLTVADNSRFIITDDFRTTPVVSTASAMAAIYSKDYLVAQAALLPLSEKAQRLSPRDRERYERLFVLIEEQALSDDVRTSAQAVRTAQFRAAEIRALEAALGDRLSPARLRYRQFLDVVKKLMDRKITAGPFLDEFRGFTQDVAGKLDFGIYSFCLDRLFGSVRVSLKVKKLLVLELLKYPPLIRRELLTNVLVYPGQVQELVEFIRYMVANELGQGAIIEIELLEAFKLRRLSMGDIEQSLARAAAG